MAAETKDAAPTAPTPARGGLYLALASAQEKCKAVAKDAANTFHHYAYASAEAIIGEAKDALAGTGLSLVPKSGRVETRAEAVAEGQPNQGVSRVLCRTFMLAHSSGETLEIQTEWPVIPDRGRPLDKAVASAATTSLAYVLRDLLLMPRVAEGEDMDHSSRDERREEPPPRRRDRSAPREERRDEPSLTADVAVARLGGKELAAKVMAALPGVADRDLTIAVQTIAGELGYELAVTNEAWQRAGRAPGKPATGSQIRAFVAALPAQQPA